jgi:hypothetical protein
VAVTVLKRKDGWKHVDRRERREERRKQKQDK